MHTLTLTFIPPTEILVGTSNSDINSLKYACALLNSRILSFYAIEKEILRKGNKATPHVGVKGLKSIPVRHLSKIETEKIARKVDEVLEAKKARPEIDTSTLEREIDQMIYDTYNLTKDEISIVENTPN